MSFVTTFSQTGIQWLFQSLQIVDIDLFKGPLLRYWSLSILQWKLLARFLVLSERFSRLFLSGQKIITVRIIQTSTCLLYIIQISMWERMWIYFWSTGLLRSLRSICLLAILKSWKNIVKRSHSKHWNSHRALNLNFLSFGWVWICRMWLQFYSTWLTTHILWLPLRLNLWCDNLFNWKDRLLVI